MEDGTWSLRLRGPRGQQATLQLDSGTDLQTFSQLAVTQLRLQNAKNATFRSGFPPRPVEITSTVLVRDVFVKNDSVVVATTTPSSAASASAQSSSSARPRRAAAKKPASARKAVGGVHTLHQPNSKNPKKAAASKRKITGSGFQLGSSLNDAPSRGVAADAAGDADTEEQQATKYRRTHRIQLSSKEDIGVSLAAAVSGGKDRTSKFFRAATKSAVEKQYEMTLANARLNAALGRTFEAQEVATTRRADGSAAQLRVRFKESPRKWKDETVDLLQPKELQAILKYVLLSGGETGREMLKPFNMAQVSTRVFWSIARLYDGDVAAGLRALLPGEDWTFLDVRTRVMSEKAAEAKANEEQWKVYKQVESRRLRQSSPSPPARTTRTRTAKTKTSDAAVKTEKAEVIAVDDSDDDAAEEEPRTSQVKTEVPALSAKQATESTLRRATAHAALSRLDKSARSASVASAFKDSVQPDVAAASAVDNSETESEEEVEEATTVYCDHCGKARILSLDEAPKVQLKANPWTCSKLESVGRTDGCTAVDDEVAQITGVSIAEWLQKASIATRKELANASVAAALHALMDPLDPSFETLRDKLERLVNEARLDEVNDWMLELVGDTAVLERLELQKLGTPADLVTIPADLVLQAAGQDVASLETVEAWQERAKLLLDKHVWLADWRTL